MSIYLPGEVKYNALSKELNWSTPSYPLHLKVLAEQDDVALGELRSLSI